MWKNNSDISDDGEPIRLYEPIQYKYKGKRQPNVSWIGGSPVPSSTEITCNICGNAVPLLVQLYVPSLPNDCHNRSSLDKTFHIFSCNTASCWRKAFAEGSNFCVGGGGIVFCKRWQEETHTKVDLMDRQEEKSQVSPWSKKTDVGNGLNDNDWNEDDTATNMDEVEALLQTMELNGPKGTGQKTKKTPKRNKSANHPTDHFQLACYEIRAVREPASRATGIEDDDDEIGTYKAGSDDKIQQMLDRYMEMEDDPEILSMLRGTSAQGCGNETEEQMPEDDRAMLIFTDRLKRSPRQVLRYAKNGTPLWSVPQPLDLKIPKCPCGAERMFEFQLMPSLLHVLDVDKHTRTQKEMPSTVASDGDEIDLNQAFSNGGQNWGAVAVYTCSACCDSNKNECVVLQNSVDAIPEKRSEGRMVVEVQMELDEN